MCYLQIYEDTLNLLKTNTIKSNTNRITASGFNYAYLDKNGHKRSKAIPCKSETYGIVKKMVYKKGENPYQPAANNIRKPLIYESLQKLISVILPEFKYTSITLNKNFKCLPHKDKGNKKESLIVGLGDYIGGELFIEGIPFDIKYNPLLFNGVDLEHWVNDFEGDRWTIVYY